MSLLSSAGSFLSGGASSLSDTLIGRYFSKKDASKFNRRAAGSQSLKWRVQDARAAGIHPLFALGASPSSFTPAQMPMSDVNTAASGINKIAQIKQLKMQENESNARTKEAEAKADYYQEMAANSAFNREQQRSQHEKDGAALAETGRPVPVRLYGPNGGQFDTSGSSPAESVEREYGGLAGDTYGLYRLATDSARKSASYRALSDLLDYIDPHGWELPRVSKSRRSVDRRGRER